MQEHTRNFVIEGGSTAKLDQHLTHRAVGGGSTLLHLQRHAYWSCAVFCESIFPPPQPCLLSVCAFLSRAPQPSAYTCHVETTRGCNYLHLLIHCHVKNTEHTMEISANTQGYSNMMLWYWTITDLSRVDRYVMIHGMLLSCCFTYGGVWTRRWYPEKIAPKHALGLHSRDLLKLKALNLFENLVCGPDQRGIQAHSTQKFFNENIFLEVTHLA